jgi:hypothetical protein
MKKVKKVNEKGELVFSKKAPRKAAYCSECKNIIHDHCFLGKK